MALTTNKKNKIIAEWKAGAYVNPSQVAKAHKISYKTAQKIVDGISQSNAHLVDVQTALELEKKSIKNPQEVSVINKIVEEKLNTVEIDGKIIKDNREILVKFQQEIHKGIGQGDYQDPQEILTGVKAVEGIEKVVNPPKPQSQNINLQQNQIVTTDKEKLLQTARATIELE